MAAKTPVRLNFDGSGNLDGFAEFQSADFVSLADGGTGASYGSLAALRTGIGLAIGTNVQAFDADLTTLSNLTHADGSFIVSDGTQYVLESGSTARTSLGLGTGDSPQFTSLTLTGNLDVRGEVTSTVSEVITIDDAFVKLNTGNSEADAGLIVETSDTNDARLFYDVSNNRWVAGENNSYDELLTQTSTDTLTNKTISGSSNTITNIGNSALSNSSFTVTDGSNSSAVSLGGTVTFTGGAGVDIAESSGTLTFTADLSEILTDFNERVDDRVGTMLTAGTNISLSYDDAAGTLTVTSTDTNTQLTEEEVEDFVGGMLTGNTETLITVTYQDSDGTIDFVVDNDLANYSNTNSGFITAASSSTLTNKGIDADNNTIANIEVDNLKSGVLDTDISSVAGTDTTLASAKAIKTYVDSQIQTEESIEDFVGGMLTGNTETLITVTYEDSDGTMDFVVDNDLANYDNTNSGFITATLTNEQVQDIVGAMFGSNTETNITATYQDSDGTIDLVADLLTEEAVEDFVAGAITAGTNVSVTYDDAAGTITIASTDTNTQLTQEQVEDFVGGMLDGDETFITVAYDDTDGNIDFTVPVKDEDNMASDSASHLATQQSIKAYVDAQLTAEDLDFQADSGGALAIDLDSETLTFTGGTGIDTSGSGNAVTFAIDSTVVTESSTDTLTNKTINFENNTAIIEFAVTVSNPGSGNKYYLDGELAANVQLIPGVTYRFDQSDNSNSGHPLRLSTTKNGTHGGGSAYTTGVTVAGSAGNAGGYTQLVVDAATADKLYYYCSSHSGMGGDAVISVQGSSFVAGTGISISGETISSTITQYADSDVQSYLSGGTGVTLSGSGEFSIGQAVATNSNVQFNDVTVAGNLDVNGTTTTIDTTNTTVTDSIIELANGTSGSPSNDAGIVIERGSADNAFIGFDESADKFIVGTGSFTGATTGNLTITTGTLVANLEGNVTGAVTGNADTATTLANARTIGGVSFDGSANINLPGVNQAGNQNTSGNATTATTAAGIAATAVTGLTAETSQNNSDLVIIYDDSASALRKMTVGNLLANAGTFSNFTLSGDSGSDQTITDGNTLEIAGGTGISTVAGATDTVTVSLDSTAITGQGALSGSVDTGNDLLLIYDNSTTSLKKVDVSSVLAAGGTGTMDQFNIDADTGSSQVVANNNTLTITGGAGIDTTIGGTKEVTVALNTEAVQDIVGAMFSSNTETNIAVTYEDSDGTIDLVATDTQLTTEQVQDIVGAMFSSNTETNITATYQDSDGTIDLVAGGGTVTEAFKTIAVSGQNNIVADSATDTLTFAAGANITLTTNDSSDTVTIAATGGAANAFSTIAVSGQSNVVADAATDTLTLVGGTGMTLTTNAGTDTITFTSSSSGGGTMPFTAFDGSTDNITLSSAATGGALPVTLAGGSSDPINMTATTQTLTSYADDDGDTKVEVERTTDNDTVHIKAGGTDVITATSSGVTITNLTVSGTTTQANELKITDTLFELNADGGSLTTDAGMIIERGSTGDNAAFIWDESTDSFVAGTTSTDGSASSNLTVSEATLKAATQSQSDNSTKVATTAYVDTAVGNLSSNSIADADNDTKIQVEEGSDEDIIRADTGGQERLTIDNNVSMSSRGGFFTHNLTMHTSETFTIASTEGTVAAGPLDVQGTVDVQGSLVIL